MKYTRFEYQTKPFKSVLYPIVFVIWLMIMILFEYFTIKHGYLPTYRAGKHFLAYLIIFNQIFVGAFFYFGISNLIIPLRYQVIKQREKEQELAILNKPLPQDWQPKVKLLYTTYNDFIPYAFHQCLQQTYANCEGVILDNSTDEKYIEKIRQFVKVHPDVEWVRDVPNHHAKAGNLDNYLLNEGKGTYDYFVILDSDEMLENDFVLKCLKFFYYTENLGVLQCNHISGRNINKFMSTFSNAGNVFWPVQNTVRSSESADLRPESNYHRLPARMLSPGDAVCIELGHGVMISKECFAAIGKFPWMVAEDLCTSIEVLFKGFNIRFASQIYGNEEFPVNAEALMVRSTKFCSANFEFFKYYWKRLFKTDMLTTFQKLDLLSFTLSVPIFAFEYISLVLCSIVLPLGNAQLGYQWFMAFPALLCYFSQMIPDAIFERQEGMSISKIIVYEFNSMFLYGSAYYLTLKCTVLALLGKPAKFNVTPKENNQVTFKQAFLEHWESVIFSAATIIVSIICSGSSWVLLSFLPGCFGFILSLKANHQSKEEKAKEERFDLMDYYALHEPEKCSVEWYE